VTVLHDARLNHLPPDTRLLPSVTHYDQLLCRCCADGGDPREGDRSSQRPPVRTWLTAQVSDLDVLRVFCGPDGSHGNALGIVRNGAAVPTEEKRLALARDLGFSETVFVDDAGRGVIDIYTPTSQLPFAGHPCVGAAWLLEVPQLVTCAGTVTVRRDGEFTRGRW